MMASKQPKKKPAIKRVAGQHKQSVTITDFAGEEENDPSSIPEFDRAMRGLIQVPKAELGAKLKRKTLRKK